VVAVIPRRRFAGAVASAALALVGLPASQAAAATPPGCAAAKDIGGEWRSYGRDNANTRHQGAEKIISAGDAPLLSPAWTFSTATAGGEGDVTGTPVVGDGCVYVATNGGWVFAMNADTGKLAWKTKLPYGGAVHGSVGLATRRVTVRKKKRMSRCRRVARARKRLARRAARRKLSARERRRAAKLRRIARRCKRLARKRAAKRRRARRRASQRKRYERRGTVYVVASRTQEAEGCPKGDPCVGPYAVALDQGTGKVVWATKPIDTQPGSDVYGSPVFFDGALMIGVSGGSAELGDEADRYAFQGSMVFLDNDDGRVLRKTWTIHPPKRPDDEFAGAGVWSTPAIDREDKVAYAGTANPFKPQAEHKYANAVVKYDVDRRSRRFGEIVGSYKGLVDEYFPALSELPCYDIPGNPPPYYPQGVGSCGDIDLDFGASPNLLTDASGRKLVGAGQKSGVYHVFDAKTMKPVWTQIVGPPTAVGGIVGSTAYDGSSVYGPITLPGYLWALSARNGAHRWIGPIADGVHWGNPVAAANGVVYSVDFSGFLNAFDARSGALLAERPLTLGGSGAQSLSWAGVSVARNTIYAAVGVLGLADGFVVAFRPGGASDVVDDLGNTPGGGGGGGGGGPSTPGGGAILAGPGASSTGYATPAMVTRVGGPLSFLNLDIVQHDVVADDPGPDGRPLFRTKLIGFGESAPVEGLDRVQSGQTYSFYCSVHPGMRGSLAVQ
jgi:outer membrane protein assembly factor BamB